MLESAVSTIMDLEDSVAAVDAEDKVVGYRNWLQLMQGTLAEEVTKDGKTFTRAMNPDRTCTAPDGDDGHAARPRAAVHPPGRPPDDHRRGARPRRQRGARGHPRRADAAASAACVDLRGRVRAGQLPHRLDVRRQAEDARPRRGRVHVELFGRVEELLGLPPLTIKVGIMDEERRTTLNLKACIAAARERVAFINTGFLDRTGDEIHTSMLAGPMVRKADMKSRDLDQGLRGLQRRHRPRVRPARPGPDRQGHVGRARQPRRHAEQKIGHPQAGASCAWVPSPTAATIHALHYHQVDVRARQEELQGQPPHDPRRPADDPARRPGLVVGRGPAGRDRQQPAEPPRVRRPLDRRGRRLLQGARHHRRGADGGPRNLPDLGPARRNWLHHGVVTAEQVDETLRRMAKVVDEQNADDPTYTPMAPDFDGDAFLAARALVFEGLEQPSGYTEPILHSRRRKKHREDP